MGGATERYDVWTRFARVHLSTPSERAVYQDLVGASPDWWSAEEIARTGHLDVQDAEHVLAGFVRASIAEAARDDAGPNRYRWRADMDYLFGGFVEQDAPVDPVCGMLVFADGAPTSAWEGRTFTFCSSLCRAAFVAFPASFAPSPEPVGAASGPPLTP